MKMIDIIKKKRDGHELTQSEIDFFVEGYTKDQIPDYQVSALLMAVFFQKMSKRETVHLTQAMIRSGETIDLGVVQGVKVDKHSTGGVGDKTTIVLAPVVAALGAPVAKMSGRGLGHTGGTLDKLESIPGFRLDLLKEDFVKQVNTYKVAIAGQTAEIAPADKKLYALRDVTGTVDNISLIAGSIMSKKLACGADAIVLDVKTGSGAFMKTLEESFELAKEMVEIGNGVGKETVAMITDMDEPLGNAIGNSLEVIEAIETLKGKGPKDFYDICCELGAQMLLLSKKVLSREEGIRLVQDVIQDGRALKKFRELIEIQGGDPRVTEDYTVFPTAKYQEEVFLTESGFVTAIQAEQIGMAALTLGAGRETKESEIDLSSGIILKKKIGDFVDKDTSVATIFYNKKEKSEEAKSLLHQSFKLSQTKPSPKKLIYGFVSKDDVIKY